MRIAEMRSRELRNIWKSWERLRRTGELRGAASFKCLLPPVPTTRGKLTLFCLGCGPWVGCTGESTNVHVHVTCIDTGVNIFYVTSLQILWGGALVIMLTCERPQHYGGDSVMLQVATPAFLSRNVRHALHGSPAICAPKNVSPKLPHKYPSTLYLRP